MLRILTLMAIIPGAVVGTTSAQTSHIETGRELPEYGYNFSRWSDFPAPAGPDPVVPGCRTKQPENSRKISRQWISCCRGRLRTPWDQEGMYRQALGIPVSLAPADESRIRFVEGFGVIFTYSISIPLARKEEQSQQTPQQTAQVESDWDRTRRRLFRPRAQPGGMLGMMGGAGIPAGTYDWASAGMAMGIAGVAAVYDEEVVNGIRNAVRESLKNVARIRHLKFGTGEDRDPQVIIILKSTADSSAMTLVLPQTDDAAPEDAFVQQDLPTLAAVSRRHGNGIRNGNDEAWAWEGCRLNCRGVPATQRPAAQPPSPDHVRALNHAHAVTSSCACRLPPLGGTQSHRPAAAVIAASANRWDCVPPCVRFRKG